MRQLTVSERCSDTTEDEREKTRDERAGATKNVVYDTPNRTVTTKTTSHVDTDLAKPTDLAGAADNTALQATAAAAGTDPALQATAQAVGRAVTDPTNVQQAADVAGNTAWGTLLSLGLAAAAAIGGGYLGARQHEQVVTTKRA